jgi:hypothetical protein
MWGVKHSGGIGRYTNNDASAWKTSPVLSATSVPLPTAPCGESTPAATRYAPLFVISTAAVARSQ